MFQKIWSLVLRKWQILKACILWLSKFNPYIWKYHFRNPAHGVYGHYTQIIWAKTKAVGCGGVIYEDGIFTKQLVICNYGESGNVLGFPVYKIGEPCSACPNGTYCEESLCGKFQIFHNNLQNTNIINYNCSNFKLILIHCLNT